MNVDNTTELNTYLDTVANFGDYLRLEVDKDYSPQTVKDYMGQMKTIQKLFEVNSLSDACLNSFSLVLKTLEKMYDDKELGLSSYKKKLDVLVKLLDFYAVGTHKHYGNHLTDILKLPKILTNYNTYKDVSAVYIGRINKIYINANILRNSLKKAWEELTVIQSNPQANKKQKDRQFHDLETIRKKWMELYNNDYKKEIKHMSICAYDKMEYMGERQRKHGDRLLTLQKNGKFVRRSYYMEYEAFLTYGLYIWAPPRRAKDYMTMRQFTQDIGIEYDNGYITRKFKYDTPEHMKHWSPEVVYNNYKTHKAYGTQTFIKDADRIVKFFHPQYWKCLEDLQNFAILRDREMRYLRGKACDHLSGWVMDHGYHFEDVEMPFKGKLLMETNLGHRLRTWSAKYLFDGDRSKATSINDLRHIFINNFFKTEQSDEDRKILSECMSHSVKTQSYYKKDDVSGEIK